MQESIWLRIKQLLILDKRVIFALSYRMSQAAMGAITILMIVRFFTSTEQGYYYVFNSLLALQIIFELGLSFVIIQYVAHYFADIHWLSKGEIAGLSESRQVFSVFFRKSFFVYLLISLCVFLLILPIGYIFFTYSIKQDLFIWKGPWILLCLFTSLNVLTIPFMATIEGSGQVVEINQFRLVQNILSITAMWFVMMVGGKLYSMTVVPAISFLCSVIFLLRRYPGLLALLYRYDGSKINLPQFSWMREVWPMQWRIAISWCSGYFLNQIFTPIIFYYQDAVSAGRFGMSMQICSMLSLFAITFVSAFNPEFCQLISAKKFNQLYYVFKRVFYHALMMLLLASVLVLIVLIVPVLKMIADRFLMPTEMLFLLMGMMLNYMIGAIALFLRAFKREPFVWVSLLGGILNAILAWGAGKYYGTQGIVFTYFMLNLVFGLPTAFWLWHKNTMHLWTGNLKHGIH